MESAVLLVVPLPFQSDGGHIAAVAMLAQPSILLGTQDDHEGARPRFEAQGLEFEVVDPGMPDCVVLPADVDVWGAVAVGELQFGLLQRRELGFWVLEQVAALLLGGVFGESGGFGSGDWRARFDGGGGHLSMIFWGILNLVFGR